MLCISSRLGIDGERNNLAEASSSEDSWSNSSLHLGKHSATCMWFALKDIKIIAPWKETAATQPVMYTSPSASPLLRLLLCNLFLLLSGAKWLGSLLKKMVKAVSTWPSWIHQILTKCGISMPLYQQTEKPMHLLLLNWKKSLLQNTLHSKTSYLALGLAKFYQCLSGKKGGRGEERKASSQKTCLLAWLEQKECRDTTTKGLRA